MNTSALHLTMFLMRKRSVFLYHQDQLGMLLHQFQSNWNHKQGLLASVNASLSFVKLSWHSDDHSQGVSFFSRWFKGLVRSANKGTNFLWWLTIPRNDLSCVKLCGGGIFKTTSTFLLDAAMPSFVTTLPKIRLCLGKTTFGLLDS